MAGANNKEQDKHKQQKEKKNHDQNMEHKGRETKWNIYLY